MGMAEVSPRQKAAIADCRRGDSEEMEGIPDQQIACLLGSEILGRIIILDDNLQLAK
jgi:hypothetical protein